MNRIAMAALTIAFAVTALQPLSIRAESSSSAASSSAAPSGSSQAAAEEWRTFTSKTGFTVEFPAAPMKGKQENESFTTTNYQCRIIDGKTHTTFLAGCTAYDAKFFEKKGAERLQKEGISLRMRNHFARVFKKAKVTAGSATGEEFDFQGYSEKVKPKKKTKRDLTGKLRVFWSGHNEYIVMCSTTAPELNADATRFLNSFALAAPMQP
ncbi:MAG: hypothetical protein ACRD3W_14930 [Terriglobales bacterium]